MRRAAAESRIFLPLIFLSMQATASGAQVQQVRATSGKLLAKWRVPEMRKFAQLRAQVRGGRSERGSTRRGEGEDGGSRMEDRARRVEEHG